MAMFQKMRQLISVLGMHNHRQRLRCFPNLFRCPTITGYPLTQFKPGEERNYLCTDSYLKRKKYKEICNAEAAENILDNMVTEKGDNSSLAVVHIDGNNMGARIMEIIQSRKEYQDAVKTMRMISKNIHDSFSEAYSVMEKYIDEKIADRIKADRTGKLYRRLILAGDEVTFICNAKAALDAVTVYLEYVGTKKMYEDIGASEEDNVQKYAFSACGGIAYFNSHFPFSDAYKVAEECCKNAKERAKKAENRDSNSNIGSFFDYQICNHISAANLKSYRNKHYVVADGGKSILMRPYYVNNVMLERISDLNQRNERYNYKILEKNIKFFRNSIPRSQAQKLKECCSMGGQETDRYIAFLKSRRVSLMENEKQYWYDALEIMDMYPEEEKNEVGDNSAE